MAKAEALKRGPGFEDKIRDARYLVGEDRFLVTFDSGKEYSLPRSALEPDDRTEIAAVRVDAKRFFFRVLQASGNNYEVPWDRVLYEAEPSYPHYRGNRAQPRKSSAPGNRLRQLRKARGLTQAQLARATGILRPNLSRIEAGKHRPTLETLEKLAAALKVPVVELIARR